MTNPDYRHYLLIVDRSGSMWGTANDATAGIRKFVYEQDALPGSATLSLYQFDTAHQTVHDFDRLREARDYTLVPRGGTALLDATGFAITEVGEKLASMAEEFRPGKVIVLIVTDGEENSSHEYSLARVKELITQQQETYGWQFSYIGANVDAFSNADSMGIPVANALNYTADSYGTRAAYAAASSSASKFSMNKSAGLTYTDEERDKAGGNG